MARYSPSSSASLRTRLSALAEYLEAVAELRTMLLHSSPSFLISNPEELISLVEVAKATLQSNGISLHTFSSCPDYLSAYKAAYFGLLLQLQAHSHNVRLESKDLQVRLNRLLFPLFTQLRVSTKEDKQEMRGGYASQTYDAKQRGAECRDSSTGSNAAPLHPATSSVSSYLSKYSSSPHPNLPPNVMLPPPAPLRRSRQSSRIGEILSKAPSEQPINRTCRGVSMRQDKKRPTLEKHTTISNDTIHFKRRQADATSFQGSKSHGSLNHAGDDYVEEQLSAVQSSDSSSEDDSDSEPSHILVPSHSPLRRTFGIFCTGKGRGAFNGSMISDRRVSRSAQDGSPVIHRRKSRRNATDIDS